MDTRRLHPTDVVDPMSALRGIIPYARSRVEEMHDDASLTFDDEGKEYRCGCYRRALAFLARAMEIAEHPDAETVVLELDQAEKAWATDPGTPAELAECGTCPHRTAP